MISKLTPTDNWQLRAWRRGELDDDAAIAFESRLFFEPGLFEAARLDKLLEAGLRDQPSPASRRHRPRRRALELAAAATLGAVAVLPLALHSPGPQPLGTSLDWVSIGARRSAGTEPMLVAPRTDAAMVAVELSTAAGDGSVVTVVLRDETGHVALQTDPLTVRDGAVSFAFPRLALADGVHEIEIRDRDDRATTTPLAIRYRRQ